MINAEWLLSIDRNDLQKVSETIDKNDLPHLVGWLSEKDDKIRYQSLLLLQNCSACSDNVYSFWDIFRKMLKSGKSYQRSIGLMLMADNVKWDKDNKFDAAFDEYFELLKDEKPITVRQCIQSLHKIVPYKKHLLQRIADNIMSISIPAVKETMRKLILFDILGVLAEIRKYNTTDAMEDYIFNALSGGLLDKKAKKQIEAMLE